MMTIINWHKTSDGLPEPRTNVINTSKGQIIDIIDEPCLVIYEGRIKPSRYLTKEGRWEGHLKNQIPDFWIKFSEMEA